METDKTGGVAAQSQASPMTRLKLAASLGSKGAERCEISHSGSIAGSYSSGLGYWKSSSSSERLIHSGTGLRMSSELTSEKLSNELKAKLVSNDGSHSNSARKPP